MLIEWSASSRDKISRVLHLWSLFNVIFIWTRSLLLKRSLWKWLTICVLLMIKEIFDERNFLFISTNLRWSLLWLIIIIFYCLSKFHFDGFTNLLACSHHVGRCPSHSFSNLLSFPPWDTDTNYCNDNYDYNQNCAADYQILVSYRCVVNFQNWLFQPWTIWHLLTVPIYLLIIIWIFFLVDNNNASLVRRLIFIGGLSFFFTWLLSWWGRPCEDLRIWSQ